MRPMSQVVLARQASWHLADANCAGAAGQWAQWEAQHMRASTRRRAAAAVRDAAALCRDCPALAACADWAETEQYTGLAAGAVYENGRRRSDGWVAPGPKPSLSSLLCK